MANAMVPLATTTLATTAATVTFSSISGLYRDLFIESEFTGTGNLNLVLRFNGDSGANYFNIVVGGNGTSAYSNTAETSGALFAYYIVSPNKALARVSILDYTATNKHKAVLNRSDVMTSDAAAYASRWSNTAAVTSVTITTTSGNNFSAGSTFSMYGISA